MFHLYSERSVEAFELSHWLREYRGRVTAWVYGLEAEVVKVTNSSVYFWPTVLDYEQQQEGLGDHDERGYCGRRFGTGASLD